MTEYINRQELLDIISERNRDTCNGKLSCLQMKRMVEGIPAADVWEVVRCRDCKHGVDGGWLCSYHERKTFPEKYCSEGGR